MGVLLDEYNKAISDEEIEDPKKRGYKDGLAAAISFLGIKQNGYHFELVRDKRHGKSRVFFVENLFKLREEAEVMQIVLK